MDTIWLFSYFFGFLVLFSSIMVVSTKNPIHSILFLVLVFCNSAAMLILLQAEFLAFLLVVVYVGAIAVLFLFVIMMIDIRLIELRRETLLYYPVGVVLVLSLSSLFFHVYRKASFYPPYFHSFYTPFIYDLGRSDSPFVFGNLLYTYLFPFFIVSSLILLVAMVGSILLTFSNTGSSIRQEYYRQVARSSIVNYLLSLIIIIFCFIVFFEKGDYLKRFFLFLQKLPFYEACFVKRQLFYFIFIMTNFYYICITPWHLGRTRGVVLFLFFVMVRSVFRILQPLLWRV